MTLIKISLLILFINIASVLKGQSLTYADTMRIIVQTWKFKEAHSDYIPEGDEDNEDFIKNSRFQFNKDMSFIGKMGNEAEKGRWEYKRQTKEIIIHSKDGEKVAMKIIFFSDSMIKFKNDLPDALVSGTLIPVK